VTGRWEQVVLQPDLTIQDINAAISGAAYEQTIAVTLKGIEFLAGTVPISGTLEGSTLRLAGGANGTSFVLLLTRSTQEDFQDQVDKIREIQRHGGYDAQ